MVCNIQITLVRRVRPVTSAFKLNFAYNTGFGDQPSVDSNDLLWMFRRAPGFMDVVAYNGSRELRVLSHIILGSCTTNDYREEER